jgi:hypothetical protein
MSSCHVGHSANHTPLGSQAQNTSFPLSPFHAYGANRRGTTIQSKVRESTHSHIPTKAPYTTHAIAISTPIRLGAKMAPGGRQACSSIWMLVYHAHAHTQSVIFPTIWQKRGVWPISLPIPPITLAPGWPTDPAAEGQG